MARRKLPHTYFDENHLIIFQIVITLHDQGNNVSYILLKLFTLPLTSTLNNYMFQETENSRKQIILRKFKCSIASDIKLNN